MTSNAKDLSDAIALLESALVCLKGAMTAADAERSVSEARSAAWRTADAGLLLRAALEFEDIDGQGITEPTGRGAMLPAPVRQGVLRRNFRPLSA